MFASVVLSGLPLIGHAQRDLLVLTLSLFGSATFIQHFCSSLDGFDTLNVLVIGVHRAPLSNPSSKTPPSAIAMTLMPCWEEPLCKASRRHQKRRHKFSLLWELPKSFEISMTPLHHFFSITSLDKKLWSFFSWDLPQESLTLVMQWACFCGSFTSPPFSPGDVFYLLS